MWAETTLLREGGVLEVRAASDAASVSTYFCGPAMTHGCALRTLLGMLSE